MHMNILVNGDYVMKFEKMSMLERGFFPSWEQILFTIYEISIDSAGISYRQNSNEYSYNWSEIQSAKIITSNSIISSGPYSHVPYKKKVLILVFPGRKLSVEISGARPWLHNTKLFVSALTEHIKIEQINIEKEQKRYERRNKIITYIFIVLMAIFAIYLKKLWHFI